MHEQMTGGRTAPAPGPFAARPRFGRLNLEVRQSLPAWKRGLFIALSLGVGLGISVAILLLSGVGLASIFEEFVILTFLDPKNLSHVLVECSPLILAGLSAAVAFRVRFWNIGIEGQFFWGAIGATAIAIHDIGPVDGRILLMMALALLGGLFWTLLPVGLKLRLGTNEIITTLLLNYVAYLFVMNQVYGPWQDRTDFFPHSPLFESPHERLPRLGWEGIHAGLPLALLITALVWWIVERSRFGTYMRFVGANDRMALAVGLPVGLVIFGAVALSGALAGAAGFVMAAAQEFRLSPTLAEGYGFSGIVIAFLARNNPVAVAVVAFLIGGLYVAGQSLQVFYGLPAALVGLMQAIIVMSVAGSEFLVRHRLKWVR